MSRFLGAQRAANADLAGPLGHGGQHDVHDADAAHQQGDGGDGAQHDVENALGLLGLPEQLQRDDDLVIVLIVEAAQQGLDLRVGGFHRSQVAHLDGDLVELHLFRLEAARCAPDEDFAEAGAGGAQGDIDIVIERLAFHFAGLAALFRLAALLHEADDLVVESVDLYRMLERVLVREEAAGQSGGDDANVVHVLLVVVRQEPPAHQRCAGHLIIEWECADDLAGNLIALKPDIFADDAHGQDARDAGNGAEQACGVVVGEAVLELRAAPAALLCWRDCSGGLRLRIRILLLPSRLMAS